MSVHVLSWVLKHSEARLADRLVLLSLADHAKDDGTGAWPSVDTLARDARVSRRAVFYSLQQLETQGLIVRTGKSQHGTVVWTVVMAVQQQLDVPVQDLHVQEVQVQNPAPEGEQSAPDPSENRPTTPPVVPPEGGRTRSRSSGRRRPVSATASGSFNPSALLDEVSLHAYRRLGIDLPDDATQADAERAMEAAA